MEGRCPCGCGHSKADCWDPSKADRWEAFYETAYAGLAKRRFIRDHQDDLPDDALVGVRLLPAGQKATDSLEFSPERAAEELEAMQRRLEAIE